MLTKQINIVQERFGRQLKEWDQENGRERHALDTNLYQLKYVLHDSDSNGLVRTHGVENEQRQQACDKEYAKQHVNGAVKAIIDC